MTVCYKYNCIPIYKTFERQKVHCTSIDDIEHVTCEYWRKDREKEQQKTFIVEVDECTIHPSIS